jgi:hypothetical protein
MNPMRFRRFQVLAACEPATLVARMVNSCEACLPVSRGRNGFGEMDETRWKARNRNDLPGGECQAAPPSLAGEAPYYRKLRNQNGQFHQLDVSDARPWFRGKLDIQELHMVRTYVDTFRLKTWQEILQKS